VEGLLVPWMLEHWGWRKTFVIVGFTALLWLVPWILALPKRISLKSTREKEERGRWPQFLTVLAFSGLLLLSLFAFLCLDRIANRAIALALGLALGALLVFLIWIVSLKRLQTSQSPSANVLFRALTACRNRNLIGICLGFFFFDYYWYFLVGWLPDYLVTVRKLTIMKAGLYAALPYLVFGASEPIGGWIADRFIRLGWDETRTRKTIVTIAFLTGLFLIPAAQVQSDSTAILLVIGGSLVGLATGNLLVILQACSPHEEIGLWTGIYNFIGNVAGILAPLITGILIKTTGSYTPAFVLAAVSIAAGQLAFWLIVGKLKFKE
jgi:nitrate/nitrite transporter NarK